MATHRRVTGVGRLAATVGRASGPVASSRSSTAARPSWPPPHNAYPPQQQPPPLYSSVPPHAGQYPSAYAPLPPPPASWRNFLRRLSRGQRVALFGAAGGAALLVVCAACALLVAIQPSLAGLQYTAAPTATATAKGPHLITGATLGGTQDAFTAAFGTPSDQGGALA